MPEGQAEGTNTQGSQDPAPGSAPETKTPATAGGSVDTAQTQHGAGLPQGAKVEFFKLREAKRSLQGENEQLKARLEALEKQVSAGSERREAKTSVFDDPDKLAADLEARAVARVKAELAQEQAAEKAQASLLEADQWLRSRSHLEQDPNLVVLVRQKLEAQASEAPITNFKAAAKAAYLDVCEDLGIEPDLARKSPTSGASSGVRPSSAGRGSGSVEYTAADIKKLNPRDPNFKAQRAEVEKAIREGRYKGTAAR